MKRGTFALGAALAVLWTGVLAARAGSAVDIRGTLANGWQRHPIAGTGTQMTIGEVYAGASGFLALGGSEGWVSRNGRSWKAAPAPLSKYALSQHIPDLNLVRVGIGGVVEGDTYSVKAEGPNGGYIAVGSYSPPGKPKAKTRAEVAISKDGRTWHTVSGKGKTFLGAEMTDVARGGPGWVAVGFSWGSFTKPVVWTSVDAIRWQRIDQQPAVAFYGEIDHLVHGPAGLLAIATGFDGPAEAWTSSDGLHWQAAPSDSFRGGLLQQVTVGGPGYLAVGVQDDDPALWASSDGLHWQRVAGAASFPGAQTWLQGVAVRGNVGVVVGRYGTALIGRSGIRFPQPVSSAWVWTPQGSAIAPTPVPRTGTINPKLFRLRLADLPTGYSEREFGGWPDFCDEGNTLCGYVYHTVGAYGAYETSFGGGQPLTQIESMAIEGTRSNAHALSSLGKRLVRWWNRGGTLKRVAAPVRIGQETRVYRASLPARSAPPDKHVVAYAAEWRDGRAIGQVYVEQQPKGPASAVETLALNLARAQWQHLKDARG